jgi:hypothetical protein
MSGMWNTVKPCDTNEQTDKKRGGDYVEIHILWIMFSRIEACNAATCGESFFSYPTTEGAMRTASYCCADPLLADAARHALLLRVAVGTASER